MTETATALIYAAPGEARLGEVALPPLRAGWVEVETRYSALSRGTERLVFEGRVPQSEWQRMRAPFQDGDFPHPVIYGYAAVGRVVAGPEHLAGCDVFALHPHQTRFRVPAEAVIALPRGVPPARAVLAANAETALNALWDAALAPGSRVLVVGAGLLGCLIAALLSRRSDLEVHITDILAERAAPLSELNVTFRAPTDLTSEYVVAFHVSASAAGLQSAIDALGFEGEVIELSWYGDRPVQLELGGAFHARRLAMRASQVAHVAPARRASTSRRERLCAALACLDDPRLDALVTEEVAFAALPGALAHLLAPGAAGIATRIVY